MRVACGGPPGAGAAPPGGAAGTITGRRNSAVRRSSIVSSVLGRISVAPQPEQNLASPLLSVPQMLHFIAVLSLRARCRRAIPALSRGGRNRPFATPADGGMANFDDKRDRETPARVGKAPQPPPGH